MISSPQAHTSRPMYLADSYHEYIIRYTKLRYHHLTILPSFMSNWTTILTYIDTDLNETCLFNPLLLKKRVGHPVWE